MTKPDTMNKYIYIYIYAQFGLARGTYEVVEPMRGPRNASKSKLVLVGFSQAGDLWSHKSGRSKDLDKMNTK